MVIDTKNMNLKNKFTRATVLLLLIFSIAAGSINAQSVKRQVISSYGSSSVTEKISVSQTAGQSYNTTSSSENKTAVLQGFQQPNKFIIEPIENADEFELELGIFPNPAEYSFTINSNTEIETAKLKVFDANGRLISGIEINNFSSHEMICSDWAPGVYLISVADQNNNSKTLRLIISK
jgi:hypothetical protein